MYEKLARDHKRNMPVALSRSFKADLDNYCRQFEAGLDLAKTIQSMSPLFVNSVHETARILELTSYRTQLANQTDQLNERLLKIGQDAHKAPTG